ncbi:MAG: TatD family hydrolase [Deltaproteobacteria bacterium]|nr:TatD family hydrolase [Deltaproteobacteria bacterium]
MAIVDVHCHLHAADFDADRDLVLARAKRVGIRSILTMGEGFADNQRALAVAAQHPALVRACLGLHPCHVDDEDLDAICAQIRGAPGIAAIGEVGLDYWTAKTDAQRLCQRQALSRLIELAQELELPLSLHSRSAGHHTLELLVERGAKRVCMHAFDGAAKHAVRAAEEHGFFFSIPPSVVRSPQKQKLARRLPLAALLLETDAPVLGADREQRNEPAAIVEAANKVAELKGVTVDQVLRAASENAQQLFGL